MALTPLYIIPIHLWKELFESQRYSFSYNPDRRPLHCRLSTMVLNI
jgi:hypothetical protein